MEHTAWLEVPPRVISGPFGCKASSNPNCFNLGTGKADYDRRPFDRLVG